MNSPGAGRMEQPSTPDWLATDPRIQPALSFVRYKFTHLLMILRSITVDRCQHHRQHDIIYIVIFGKFRDIYIHFASWVVLEERSKLAKGMRMDGWIRSCGDNNTRGVQDTARAESGKLHRRYRLAGGVPGGTSRAARSTKLHSVQTAGGLTCCFCPA